MNLHYGVKRLIARPVHTFYIVTVLAMMQQLNFDYVSKMVYNKDKDLVFVYRPDGLWGDHEYVYEMHHLEQMVPAPITSFKHLTMNRDDGILTVHCMSTRDDLKFYNEDKYWNIDEKQGFIDQTRSLWHKRSSDKYNGHIFSISSRANEEDALMVRLICLFL